MQKQKDLYSSIQEVKATITSESCDKLNAIRNAEDPEITWPDTVEDSYRWFRLLKQDKREEFCYLFYEHSNTSSLSGEEIYVIYKELLPHIRFNAFVYDTLSNYDPHSDELPF